jgi:predicted acyl esterase
MGKVERGARRARLPLARVACALALVVTASVVEPLGAAAHQGQGAPTETDWPGGRWEPGPQSYGMEVVAGLPVTMDDGVVLHANVGYPTDLATGQRAPGSFPVLLTQNPYVGGGNPDPFYVGHGYIHVVAEVRGTGNSLLSADDPDGPLTNDMRGARSGLDGALLVNWVAHELEGSNGRVGLNGCSWLGVNQLLTAAALSPNSPVEAMVPACADGAYSTFFMGGVATGTVFRMSDPSFITGAKHEPENTAMTTALQQDMLAGGDLAYNREFWQERNLYRLADRIVDNGVPALLWMGWNASELATGGIDLYSAFQNSLKRRPTLGPMKADKPSSGRYQIIVNGGGHGFGLDKSIQLEWYDTWVKGERTKMDKTHKGMHLFELGANRWINHASWPITDQYTPFYLSDGGVLSSTPARHSAGLAFGPATEPGTTLTYESAALPSDQTLAGPVGATLHVRSINTNAHLVTTLYSVAPDGTATEITFGSLIASGRELDPARSWYDRNGLAIKPEGLYLDSEFIEPGELYRLDIRVVPTVQRVPAGHRLRLVVATQAPAERCAGFLALTRPSPCIFTATQAPTLPGGHYEIVSGPETPSSVNLPLVDPASLSTAASGTTPTSPTVTQPLDWG